MKISQSTRRSAESPRGFTLMEILVVITLIIGLAVIVMTVTRNAKLNANKVADMNNLRGLATAAMAAGNDSAGRLPQVHSGAARGNTNSAPYWLAERVDLEAVGIFKEMCYAPTRNIFGGAPNYDWWGTDSKDAYPGGTPTHYVYFANDANTTTPTDAWFLKGTVVKPERSEYRGSIPYDTITQDRTKAFARNFTDDAWYPVLWAGLCRDWPGSARVAAIMHNGEALGVNVMYLDGSSEWVPKKKMKQRYSTSGGLKLLW